MWRRSIKFDLASLWCLAILIGCIDRAQALGPPDHEYVVRWNAQAEKQGFKTRLLRENVGWRLGSASSELVFSSGIVWWNWEGHPLDRQTKLKPYAVIDYSNPDALLEVLITTSEVSTDPSGLSNSDILNLISSLKNGKNAIVRKKHAIWVVDVLDARIELYDAKQWDEHRLRK